MKRFAILFAASVLAVSFTGCANLESSGSASPASEQTDSASVEEDAVSSQTQEDDTGAESAPETEQPEESSTGNESLSFEETVLVDNDFCVMKATEIEEDGMWGYTVKVYIENKTSDKTLMFTWDDVAVNGIMLDPFWAKSIMPGTKANEEVTFSKNSMKESGITKVTEITGTYRVYDHDNWGADDFAKDSFAIYPYGEDAADNTLNVDGETLFESNGVKMVIVGYEPDSTWGYTMKVHLENRTDKNLMFSITDSSVNGYAIDPFWAESVAPGKSSFEDISWSSSELEKNNITQVEEITMKIRVHDADDWAADDIINDTYTVKPE